MRDTHSEPQTHGVTEFADSADEIALHRERLKRDGFTRISGALDDRQVRHAREAIDAIYYRQVRRAEEIGIDLASIQDSGVARALLLDDDFFLTDIALNDDSFRVVSAVLGKNVVLHSQVATISKPGEQLYQTAWHRELQYQHFVSSRPLALQTIFCIDPFTRTSGATYLIPGSHRFEEFPSASYCAMREEQFLAEPGDVLVMDSMVYHRAGVNIGNFVRRLITNTFTVPVIGQQIDLSSAPAAKRDPFLNGLLGGRWNAAESVESWRSKASDRRHQRASMGDAFKHESVAPNSRLKP